MDAAQINIKKIAFFLASALLLTAPIHGLAQTLSVSQTAVIIGSSQCNNYETISLASSDGSNLGFTVQVIYSPGNQYGNWLYATDQTLGASTTSGTGFTDQTGTTGVTLKIGLNLAIGAVTPNASVLLTPTNGSAAVTIAVNYTQNTSCGGNTGNATNGVLTVTPGNVALAAGIGGQNSQVLVVQNVTGNSLTFAAATQGGSWLSSTTSSITLSPNGSANVTVTGNAATLTSTQTLSGSIDIQAYLGAAQYGTTIAIPISFVVGTGSGNGGGGTSSGTLTLNGATSNTYSTTFSYALPNAPGGICVPIQDTAASAGSYYYQVNTTNGGNWLLANYNTSGTTVGLLAPSSNACVNVTLSNVANTLPTGAYQGSVSLTSSSGATATINVTLYISAGAAPGITVSPGTIYSFPNVPVNSTTLQQQQFTITAAPGYNLGTAMPSSTPGWFTMTNPTSNNGLEFFTVTANPTGLTAGIYTASITMTSSGTAAGTTTILVVLPVGQSSSSSGNSGGGVTTLVAPMNLSFQQQAGTSFWTSGKEAQNITITGQQGTAWSATLIFGAGGTNWLNFDNGSSGTFGSGPANLTVDLFNGVSNLTPSTQPYVATVSITTPSGVYSVGVTILVTASNTPVLIGSPSYANFSLSSSASASSQTVSIVGSDNTGSTSSPLILAGSPTAAWLTATTSGNTMTLTANPSGLSTGVYSGTVQVTSSAYSNAINYPVVLVVNGGGSGAAVGPLTLSSTSLNFTNVTSQISQTVNLTAASTTAVTAYTTPANCGSTWLGISPSGSLAVGTVNVPITVTVNPSGVSNGTTCTGTISFQTASATQTVSVSMTVGGSTGGGNITVSPLSMTFAYTQGQTAPAAQTATIVNATSGTSGIPFSVTSAVSGSVANWIGLSTSTGTTPFNSPGLSVSVVPGSLGVGTYNGTVTITPTGGTAQVINVTLTVTGTPVVTATPTTLTLTYLVGSTAPTATIQVSAGGATAGFTAAATTSAGWLQVSPTSGTTPNTGTFNLTVSTVASVLSTLTPGSYTGTVTITGTSPATGTTIVNVTLNVTAPLPTINGVTNAASGATGPISPGEIISIYAPSANPIGPTPYVTLSSTTCPSPCTQVPNSMGGVTVTFLPLGINAPLTYVSATQINAVVPYEVATAGSSQSIEVKYLNQTSNAFPVTLATTAPGIFTALGTGTGQAAVGEYSPAGAYNINSASAPAHAGYVLVIYMTGEGVVNPAAKTGSVTANSTTQPYVAPTVTIDNQPATVQYYGEAYGLVSGVLQINVLVPSTTHTGAVSLQVGLGTAVSQAGVTVYLQ